MADEKILRGRCAAHNGLHNRGDECRRFMDMEFAKDLGIEDPDADKPFCLYCGRTANFPAATKESQVELRPYGPGGALVCFDCAMLPEHEEETGRNFVTLLHGAEAAGGGVAVLTEDGPAPFDGNLDL